MTNSVKNGWIHSGDLYTVDENGFSYLTEQKKVIIKMGSPGISPKEIEKVILSITNAVDCSIEGVDKEIWGKRRKPMW
jgi:acyl-CoA synthetase (AMP-forming)/AMP-acid ligase II